MRPSQRAMLIAAAALYAVLLGLFFYKYVPLVGSFLTLLAPLLAAVLVLAAVDPRRALFLFLAVFPLTGSLPYHFRLYENVPQAPATLVLFLVFLAGFLIHIAARVPPGGGLFRPAQGETAIPARLIRPLGFAMALVMVSALVTASRFTDFYPFIADRIYELPVNVSGVTAGGALMSVVFTMLSYLCGVAFFILAARWLRPGEDTAKALRAFGAGLLLAILFGYIQRFSDPALGNTPFWTRLGQVNGTFKDPNAFGTVLALAIPVFLAMAFGNGGRLRIQALGVSLLGLGIFPFIGIRSAVLALFVSFIVLAVLTFPLLVGDARKSLLRPFRRPAVAVLGIVVLITLLVLLVLVLPQSSLFQRLSYTATSLSKAEGADEMAQALSRARLNLWTQALAMLRDFPLTGVGVGAFIVELPNYYALRGRRLGSRPGNREYFGPTDSAENLFLQVGSETGVLGLGVFLWLIGRLGQALWRRRPRPPGLGGNPEEERRQSFLFAGLVAALAGFFINAVFHSYVGSFEVIFAVGLILGLTFHRTAPRLSGRPEGDAATADERPEVAHGAPARRRRFLAGLAVLAFGAVHFVASFGPLSPGSRIAEFDIRKPFGVYPPEKDASGREFRWTARTAGFIVRVEKPALEWALLAAHPDIAQSPVHVRVKVFYDGLKRRAVVGDLVLTNSVWLDTAFSLAPYVGQQVLLILDVSRTWSPKAAGLGADSRELGVAVGTAAFR